jgi:dCMP deaminase
MNERPDWTNYFLGLAFMASRRSRDIHTKHGCVITDKGNRILGVGYNSWPAGMRDEFIPINRPLNLNDPEEESKYDWVVHSEENAILNSNGTIRGANATAYITGTPCHHCSMLMAQVGIVRFVIAKRKGWQKETDKSKRQFEQLIHDRGIDVEYVIPDLSWILEGMEDPIKLGFASQKRDE